MRPLPSLASLALVSIAVAAPATMAATTEIVQQRLSDGRILLTDRPVRGATTERSWQMTNEDPAAARQRAADVRAEAKEVSERIQRMLDQERRADEERERTRLAALAMARQSERNDDPASYGGVVPYGYGTGLAVGQRHGRGGHHGKPPVEKPLPADRWGRTEKFGTVGRYGAAGATQGAESPMFSRR